MTAVGFVVHAPASLDGLYRCRRTKSTVVRANGRGFGRIDRRTCHPSVVLAIAFAICPSMAMRMS
jgi:hypothetical protein